MNELINELAVKHLTLTYNGTSNSFLLDGLDKFVELIQAEEREKCIFIIQQYALTDSPCLLADICNTIKEVGEAK